MNLLPPEGTLTMRSGAAETIFCGAMLAEARRNTMRNAAVKLIFLTGLIGAVCAGGLALRSVRLHTKEVKAPENPLKLDAATEAIFAHADKVEALRLADFLDSSTRSRLPRMARQNAYGGVRMLPLRGRGNRDDERAQKGNFQLSNGYGRGPQISARPEPRSVPGGQSFAGVKRHAVTRRTAAEPKNLGLQNVTQKRIKKSNEK